MSTIAKNKKCSWLLVLSVCLLVLSLCLHAQLVLNSEIQFGEDDIFSCIHLSQIWWFLIRGVQHKHSKTKLGDWNVWIPTSSVGKVSFSCYGTNYLQHLWYLARNAQHRKIRNLGGALGILKSSFGRLSPSLKYHSQNAWYLARNAKHQKIIKCACACSCSNCACWCSACAP